MRQPLFFFSRRNKSAKIWRISVTQSQSREKSRGNLAHPTRYRPGSRTLARRLNSNLDNSDADVQRETKLSEGRPLRRPGPPRRRSDPPGKRMAARNVTLALQHRTQSNRRKPHGRAKCNTCLAASIAIKSTDPASPRLTVASRRPRRPIFGRRARGPSPAPSTGYGRSER